VDVVRISRDNLFLVGVKLLCVSKDAEWLAYEVGSVYEGFEKDNWGLAVVKIGHPKNAAYAVTGAQAEWEILAKPSINDLSEWE